MRGSNRGNIREDGYWQRHVDAFKSSGLTREAYSKKNHIQVYQLDYWRKKISRIRETPSSLFTNKWVPLEIHDDSAIDAHIDLWIGHIRIEIKHGFDPKLLEEVLRAMRGTC